MTHHISPSKKRILVSLFLKSYNTQFGARVWENGPHDKLCCRDTMAQPLCMRRIVHLPRL